MKTKTFIPLFALTAFWLVPTPILAQVPPATFKSSPTSEMPQAVVISVHGKCEYSENGLSFTELRPHHVLNQGVVLRTGPASRVDVFFRRIGTTVRLQADTEVKLEKMTRSTNAGGAEMQTLLHLRKGRIFTAVRSSVPGSTFEIRNAAGRSVVEGGGSGRYIITADGTQVADKGSAIPLKVIGDTGITVIEAGQSYRAKEGKMLPVAAPEEVLTMIELDELHALAEDSTFPRVSPSAKPESRKK
jgi:hypothetical protein